MYHRRPLSLPTFPAPHGDPGDYSSMNDNEGTKQRREVLGLLNSLRSLGLTQTLDFPQIAVIGSQGAGKSSLIEALSKVKLPQSAGICTRCPIECEFQYTDSPWRAQVFLKFEGSKRASDLGDEIPFGDPLDDPDLAEERIKLAQLAVLNPEADPGTILSGEAPQGGLSFTKNTVIVKFTGPINVSTLDEKNKGDIKLVQELIGSYMSKSSTINLIVLSCETDYESQATELLAKKYDPTGERTIGVLTKPDRIEHGQEGEWIPFITGHRSPMMNGWYCVKQLAPRDRKAGVTWEEARVQEFEFFENRPGWSTIPPQHKGKLGWKSLAEKLLDILVQVLQKMYNLRAPPGTLRGGHLDRAPGEFGRAVPVTVEARELLAIPPGPGA